MEFTEYLYLITLIYNRVEQVERVERKIPTFFFRKKENGKKRANVSRRPLSGNLIYMWLCSIRCLVG